MGDTAGKKNPGRRLYGVWSGKPRGIPEDPERCAEEIMEAGSFGIGRQCSRRRGHGPGGEYCRVHGRQHEEAARRRRARENDGD